MANKKWKGKKMIAAGLGGGVLLAAVALTQDPDLKNVLAAGDPKETLSLAIAGEEAVSYTHLDVYKRQDVAWCMGTRAALLYNLPVVFSSGLLEP